MAPSSPALWSIPGKPLRRFCVRPSRCGRRCTVAGRQGRSVVSSFRDVVDAIVDDLVNNVAGLRGVIVHRYGAWDPGQSLAEAGERHLAVWPDGDALDTASPLTTDGGKQLVQIYRIAYWEDAGDESQRGILDEEAAGDLLDLTEATRARFFKRANVFIGGTELLEYIGASTANRSGTVRWFQVSVSARTSQSLS